MNTGRQLEISASLSMAVKALNELSEPVSSFCCFSCTAGLAHGREDTESRSFSSVRLVRLTWITNT